MCISLIKVPDGNILLLKVSMGLITRNTQVLFERAEVSHLRNIYYCIMYRSVTSYIFCIVAKHLLSVVIIIVTYSNYLL